MALNIVRGYRSPFWKSKWNTQICARCPWFWRLAASVKVMRWLLALEASPVDKASFVFAELASGQTVLLGVERPPQQHSSLETADDSECQALSLLRLHGVCYHFCHSRQSFSKVPGMPSNLVLQLDRAALALKSIEKGEPQTPDCQPFAAQRCHLDGNRDRAQLSV
ncbi:hypothetical protein ABBQ38_006589 [Trebouxia sp. C0009 RCD-2024]